MPKAIPGGNYEPGGWTRKDAAPIEFLTRQDTARDDAASDIGRASKGVNDGNGFVFIDHVGNICPSGFLPAPRGNVRSTALTEVYRTDEMFVRLRDADALAGKCGRCRFRGVCGGSRSRAYAATGAVMASDPLCAYEPGAAVEPLIAQA